MVAIADINVERMNMLQNELKERLITFKCDVTNEEDVKKAIEGTVSKFGTIHVVLTSAGIVPSSFTLSLKGSLDMNLFKKCMEINVYGSVYVAKHAAIVMSKNKPLNDQGEKGVIIFVSSVAAEEGKRG